MNHFARQHGLTLVELLAVLTILTILFGAVNANFIPIVERHETRSALGNLYGTFQQARSAAITGGTIVTICPLDNSDQCAHDWNLPIYSFTDPENELALTQNTETLHITSPPSRGSIEARPSWKSYFQFRANGTARGALGNITYCPQSNAPERAGRLLMNMGGRLRFAQDHSGDGVVQGSDGTPIDCD